LCAKQSHFCFFAFVPEIQVFSGFADGVSVSVKSAKIGI
jgi:hypothetical protein